MKKRIIAMLLAALMVMALCACGSSSSAAPAANGGSSASAPAAGGSSAPAADAEFVKLNLKFATFLTETNPAQEVITTLQAKLEEKMPGMITITTYANGTLLGTLDIYDGVVSGIADIGFVEPDLMPDRFPISQLTGYPAVAYNSSEVASRVWTEFLQTNELDEYKDVVTLFGFGQGPGAIYTHKRINTLDDFNGLQIRATGNSAPTIAAYGATPTTMEFSEVYEALRSGLVDGCYTNFGAGAVMKFQEVVEYALITPLYNSVYTYVMNKDVWNKMPAAQQELFMEAVAEMNEEYNFTYGDANLVSNPLNRNEMAELEEVYFLEGDMLEAAIAATANLTGDYIASIEAKGYDGTGALAKLGELADKYNAQMTWDDYKALYAD